MKQHKHHNGETETCPDCGASGAEDHCGDLAWWVCPACGSRWQTDDAVCFERLRHKRLDDAWEGRPMG